MVVEDFSLKEDFVKTYQDRNVNISNEAAYKMHLEACIYLSDKIIKGGFICFDDVWLNDNNEWEGKGKTAIPYLLENGFKLVAYKKTSALFQSTKGYSESEIINMNNKINNININYKILIRRISRIPYNFLRVFKII